MNKEQKQQFEQWLKEEHDSRMDNIYGSDLIKEDWESWIEVPNLIRDYFKESPHTYKEYEEYDAHIKKIQEQ